MDAVKMCPFFCPKGYGDYYKQNRNFGSAGSTEALAAAVRCGANAVYLGTKGNKRTQRCGKLYI